MKELIRTYSIFEADIIRSRLAASEIEAFIFDREHSNNAWHLQVALGGVRVYVFDEDYEEAEKILSDKKPPTPKILNKKAVFLNFILTLPTLFILLFYPFRWIRQLYDFRWDKEA